MTKLGRPHFTKKPIAAELDNGSIVRRERPACQQGMNGFAGADEIRGFFPNRRRGFFPNRRHGGFPYEQGNTECGKDGGA